MEIYLLDSLYRRIDVIDKYESFIWTERFSAWGDFELSLLSSLGNRNRLSIGNNIFIVSSYRVMTIETIEDTVDDDGRKILKVRGRSLEAILENRLARGELGDLTTTPKWVKTGTPAVIATSMFNTICLIGDLDPGDIIENIELDSSIFPVDTIPFPTDNISYEIDMMSLYQAIKDLCDVYGMGFRIVRDLTGLLFFDIYMGSDRTTQQTVLPAVVFSQAMDNLTNITELSSDVLYKNVAYVVSSVGNEVVYAPGVDPSVAGFERRVLFIKAEDINDPTPAVASAQMIQRGIEELGKNRKIAAFDGALSPSSKYKYGTDYNLGDLIEFQNDNGVSSVMKVVEQIFVSDKEGVRGYPTLVINEFVNPGAWNTWVPDQVWNAVTPTTLVWNDAN